MPREIVVVTDPAKPRAAFVVGEGSSQNFVDEKGQYRQGPLDCWWVRYRDQRGRKSKRRVFKADCVETMLRKP